MNDLTIAPAAAPRADFPRAAGPARAGRRQGRSHPVARPCRLSLAEIEAGGGGTRAAVVYCQRGGKVSQLAAPMLRARGVPARILEGGHLRWLVEGFPTVPLDPLAARWVMPMDPDFAALCALGTVRRLIDPQVPVLPVARDQLEAACRVWDAAILPGRAGAVAARADLVHPVCDALDRATECSLDRLLAGRLRRRSDPLAALDLVDDFIAGTDA